LYLPNSINQLLKRPLITVILCFGAVICGSIAVLSYLDRPPYDLPAILNKGELIFITRNNAHCYYHYRDEKMGLEYDLAKALADELGVKLTVKIAERWSDMLPHLIDTTGQIVGASITATPARKERVAFSDSYMTIRQHVISRRTSPPVRRVEDLAGKTVQVRRNTSYEELLQDLQNRGIDVIIQPVDNIPTAELIRHVADGRIDYTVADSNVALLNRRNYPGVRISAAISGEQPLAWAVHPNAHRLRARINTFFQQIKKDGRFKEIHDRYYAHINTFDYVDLRAYHRRLVSRMPLYGKIIRDAAQENELDWRLIAAQIYQESHFRKWARSSAGAHGLMQLTSRTAEAYGLSSLYNPVQNIHAGVRHLRMLYDLFDEEAEGAEQIFIALGAYNIGQGHIRDAQKIARQMELDPGKWASLVKTLPLLEQSEYFSKARYGYARGSEAVQYVKHIMIYYDILKHKSIQFDTGGAPIDDLT
jgi:membrane-bound lytic murein transglycosylase F